MGWLLDGGLGICAEKGRSRQSPIFRLHSQRVKYTIVDVVCKTFERFHVLLVRPGFIEPLNKKTVLGGTHGDPLALYGMGTIYREAREEGRAKVNDSSAYRSTKKWGGGGGGGRGEGGPPIISRLTCLRPP